MGVETKTLEAMVYTCDSCGTTATVPVDATQPDGITLEWFEIASWGATGGKLWACKMACAIKALRKRHD